MDWTRKRERKTQGSVWVSLAVKLCLGGGWERHVVRELGSEIREKHRRMTGKGRERDRGNWRKNERNERRKQERLKGELKRNRKKRGKTVKEMNQESLTRYDCLRFWTGCSIGVTRVMLTHLFRDLCLCLTPIPGHSIIHCPFIFLCYSSAHVPECIISYGITCFPLYHLFPTSKEGSL